MTADPVGVFVLTMILFQYSMSRANQVKCRVTENPLKLELNELLNTRNLIFNGKSQAKVKALPH